MTAPAVQRTTELLGLLVVLTAVAVLPWSLYQLSSLHPSGQSWIPTSLEDAKAFRAALGQLGTHPTVLAFFVSLYIVKQTFAIPGSVILNLLGGSLFGALGGFLLCNFLACIGATCCYCMSHLLGGRLVRRCAGHRFTQLQQMIADQEGGNLFLFLVGLRLFPFTPNWLLNLVAPLVGVPMLLFSASVFVGLAPYNYTTVQAGELLLQVEKVSDILSWGVVLKLLLVALAAALPAWLRRRHRRRTTSLSSAPHAHPPSPLHLDREASLND